jgi:6-phosphogluconolactonase (cycloisomerase 2 family)
MTTFYTLDYENITAYTISGTGPITRVGRPLQSNGAKRLAIKPGKPTDARLIAVGDEAPNGRMHTYSLLRDGGLVQPSPDTTDKNMPSSSLAVACCSALPNFVYIAGGSPDVNIVSYRLDNPPRYSGYSASAAELGNISSLHMTTASTSAGNYMYVTSQSDNQSAITSFKLTAFGSIEYIDESDAVDTFSQSTIISNFAYVLAAPGSQVIYAYPINEGKFSDPITAASRLGDPNKLPQIVSTKNGKYLYASSLNGITAFFIDPKAPPVLQQNGGMQPCPSQDFRLAIVGDQYLVACARDTPYIYVYSIDRTGSISLLQQMQTPHPNIDIAVFNAL